MPNSLNLVFQYFLAAGAGIGFGLILTIGIPLLIYKKVRGGSATWNKKKRA